MLAPYPTWLLDHVGEKEQSDRHARIAQLTPVRVRLGRIKEAAPICANTDKPIGVKKARRTLKQIVEIEKEMEEEEKRLAAYVETFSHQTEIGFKSLDVMAARNE